jgi:hypothetical protein
MSVEVSDTSAIINSIDCLDREIPVKTSSTSSFVTQSRLLLRLSNYFVSYFCLSWTISTILSMVSFSSVGVIIWKSSMS